MWRKRARGPPRAGGSAIEAGAALAPELALALAQLALELEALLAAPVQVSAEARGSLARGAHLDLVAGGGGLVGGLERGADLEALEVELVGALLELRIAHEDGLLAAGDHGDGVALAELVGALVKAFELLAVLERADPVAAHPPVVSDLLEAFAHLLSPEVVLEGVSDVLEALAGLVSLQISGGVVSGSSILS